MIEPLHILLVADPPEAAAPTLDALRRAGYDPRPRVVAAPVALGAALDERPWDVVVAVASPGGISPYDALSWTARRRPSTPAFVVGDLAGEAVALIEAGATDLLAPDQLARLAPALAKALRQRGARAEDPAPPAAALPIGLYRTSPDGRVLYANPALARLLGRSSVDDVLGSNPAEGTGYPREAFEAALGEGDAVQAHEASWTLPDGRTLVTREHARAVRGPDGAVLYFEGTIEDVTAAHAELRRERDRADRLATLLAAASALDAATDREGVARAAAEGFERLTGLPGATVVLGEEAALPATDVPLVHAGRTLGLLRAAAPVPPDLSEAVRDLAGRTASALARVDALALAATARRARAADQDREQERREARRVLTALALAQGPLEEVLPHATAEAARALAVERVSVWVREGGGHFRCRSLHVAGREGADRVPPLRLEDLGKGRDALQALRVYAHPDIWAERTGSAYLDAHYAQADVQAVLAAPLRLDGEVCGFVACEHVGAPRAWSEEAEGFVAALADRLALALERERRAAAEAALRASEARYRAVSELAADYAYGVRVDAHGVGTPDWATQAFERVTGFALDAFSSTTELIRAAVHPEDQDAVLAAQQRLYAGEPYDLTFRLRPEGRGERWVRHRSRPVLDEAGRVVYLYATGRDVTDRVVAERRLREAARAAEDARTLAEDTLRRKGTFVAAMSHEIRTPLTGIIGFAEVLAEEVEGPHGEFAGLIAESGRRLLGTINSVLDLARLESGEAEVTPTPLDLVQEVRQSVEILSPLARERGLSLALDAPPAVEACLDVACLNRIVNNLVGNALKFTEAGGVTVRVTARGGEVRLAVADTGPGIAPAFVPYLFQEYKREAPGGVRREGTGLGLTITKGLVDLMGGRIEVETALGEGTTVTVTLPISPALAAEGGAHAPRVSLPDLFEGEGPPAPEAEAPPGAPEGEGGYTLRPVIAGAEAGTGGDGASPAGPPRPRLLVVEDHADTCQLFRRVLAPAYTVEIVSDARAALDLLSRSSFDALLLDIHLGGRQTGADVLRVARTLPGHTRTPALAVTAYALPGDRERLLAEGFAGYVSKPFAAQDVLDALAEVVAVRSG